MTDLFLICFVFEEPRLAIACTMYSKLPRELQEAGFADALRDDLVGGVLAALVERQQDLVLVLDKINLERTLIVCRRSLDQFYIVTYYIK